MNLTRIIVLANSRKQSNSCLAGIEMKTGKWVRPVTNLPDGGVRKSDMRTGGGWPQLLDILDIPLDTTGPDFEFESENRTILPGPWYLRGRADVKDILKYVQHPLYVLHNDWKYVSVEEMKQKDFQDRTTLELIRVDDFSVRDTTSPSTGKQGWKGLVVSGGRVLDLPITDPVFCERMATGHRPSGSCLLTMSLSMPHKPADWQADDAPVCWKLIAGIIEL
jgi:hypothetical protein